MAKQWRVASAAPSDFLSDIELPAIARQLLYNRGIRSKEAAELFLNPELADKKEYDPFLFKNMAAAVDLIIEHIKKQNKIAVCGDYDADGVSSSAIITETLSCVKGMCEVWIPSRFGQGYGLNNEIVDELKAKGFSLIITVDNGIRSKNEVAYAKSLGLDIIVTDHHEGPPDDTDLPDCLIINPILRKEAYPFKYLCGAGVAFKVAMALLSKSKLPVVDQEKLLERLAMLAGIGTIADCVPLVGENRLLAKRGLELLNLKPRLGIRALMEVAGISLGEVTEWSVSWQLTPRLNVAGRLAHANAAYQLLVTTDPNEAKSIAKDLHTKNAERQALTAEIVQAAIAEIEKTQRDKKILFAISPNVRDEKLSGWNEGVIGLAAGRLSEKYARPAVVITRSEGKIKGSGRSIEQFNLVDILEIGKEHLERYGGHKMACGFSVKDLDNLDPFITKAHHFADQTLQPEDLTPVLYIDAVAPLPEVSDDFIEVVERFSPFGTDNPEPLFQASDVVQEIVLMGKDKNHIKFRCGKLWALGFNRAAEWKNIAVGQTIDFVYTVGFNIFNGRREPQLKIVDLRVN